MVAKFNISLVVQPLEKSIPNNKIDNQKTYLPV